jgi:hypothetical protein
MSRAALVAVVLLLVAAPAANAQFGGVETTDPVLRTVEGVPGGQLTADGAGRGLWGSYVADPATGKLQMAVYERCGPGGPAWARTKLLGVPDPDLFPVGIQANAHGDVLAVWRVHGPLGDTYWSSVRPAGGTWGAQQAIVTANTGGFEVKLGATGAAVAAWNDSSSTKAAFRPAGGSWSTTPLASAGQQVKVAISAAGEAIVLTRKAHDLQAYSRPPAGPWSGAVKVAALAFDIPTDMAVEFDGSGRPVAMYAQQALPRALFGTARDGGAWTDPPAVLDQSSGAGVGTLVRHPSGVVALWYETGGLVATLRNGSWAGTKKHYSGAIAAAAAVASDGRILVAIQKDDEILGAVGTSLPDALARLSPAKGPLLYRTPLAAAGGSTLFLGWGVHNAPTTYSQAIATAARPACASASGPPGSQPQPKPLPKPIGGFVKLAKSNHCVKARKMRIKPLKPAGFTVKQITIRVNGKKKALLKGSKLKHPFTLRRLPKGRYTIKVTVKLADGRSVSGSRRFRACR